MLPADQDDSTHTYFCTSCGDDVHPPLRAVLQMQAKKPVVCKPCGERNARAVRSSWCVAPLHKSNYVLITDAALLAGLNNKGGLVR